MFKRSLLLALVVTLVTAGAVPAATWYGDVSDSYATPANWGAYAVPAVWEDVTVKAVPVGSVTNDCNVTTIVAGGAGAVYIQNGGVLNLRSPANGTGIIAAYQFNGSSYINEGTLNTYYPTAATNALRCTSNFYVGTSNGLTGTLNIRGGITVKSGATLTIGGSNGGSGGTAVINQYGHLDFTNLRLRWNNIGSYTWRLYPGCDVWWGGTDGRPTLNAGIASGNIISGVVGYAPVADYNSVSNATTMTCVRLTKAYIPSPADASTIAGMNTPSQVLTLSWTKPLPSDPLQAVTSNVYFSNDANFPLPASVVATGTLNNSVAVTANKLATYYWRVDSYDPNFAATTTGDTWSFNTNNTAPAITISAPYQTAPNGNVVLWLPGNTSATINATVVDDGYPGYPSGTVSYLWERQNLDPVADPNWYTISTTSSASTPTYASVVGTVSDDYNYRLTCSDTALTTVRTFLVRVFVNTCAASPRMTGYVGLTGDFSADCRVSFLDFATFANNWMTCNAVGGNCN